MNAFEQLHPALQYHIVNSLGWSSLRPTQLEAIEPIQQGVHCLLLAPTAGGKTEAAIIPVLSRMLSEEWTGVSVLYVCPIKALLNNLELRLTHYAGLVGRSVGVWHGDISQARKQKALKAPPDILLTTPESLEGMLISTRVERLAWFTNLRTVVVDELHAFAGDDRGWHLRSILSRLDRYMPKPLQRIGLSATVSNPTELLTWFAPYGERRVVGSASVSTDADVTIDYVGSLENAATVISRLHHGQKRLVFCDSRGNTERLSSLLREHGVRTFVSHASLSASERKQAEVAFAEERDCVIVATSTLELGIDVGDLDQVIQLDAPATVSSFLQRMGRTGRRPGSRRNCLFLATNTSAFLLALGVAEMWSRAWVEAAVPPAEPWGVVAQQAITMTLELGLLPHAELLQQLQKAFPEYEASDIEVVIAHLIESAYLLHSSEGVFQIGPQTEAEFGRGHYRDLLATFAGADLLTGRYGTTDIGYIDPSVLSCREAETLILLAGRSWRALDVDWSKRVVRLEPAPSGGKARWLGGSKVVGAEVCSAMRDVVARGDVSGTKLSKRARLRLDELQDEIPATPGFSITKDEKERFRIWTFAGTQANRVLNQLLGELAGSRGFDEIGINTVLDPRGKLGMANERKLALTTAEVERFQQATKFSSCLPDVLFKRMVYRRVFGLTDS